jgi:outer membrane PBP1 activator LpoA protein
VTDGDEVYYKPNYKSTDLSLVNQTNFAFFNKRAFFRPFSSFITISLIALFLSSCSAPKKVAVKTAETTKIVKSATDIEITAQQLITKAQTQEFKTQMATLVTASELLIVEENFPQALWLAEQLSAMTQDNQHKYRLALVNAHSLLTMNEIELAFEQLELADLYLTGSKINHQNTYYFLLARVQKQRRLPISSLSAKLQWFALSSQANNDDSHQLWQELSLLSTWQVTQLAKQKPPHFKGWQQLLSYAHKFGNDSNRFNRYLTQWQRSFPAHPAQVVIESLRVTPQYLDQELQNIVVILPLSGKQAAAGKAAQQGVLAAYKNNAGKNLHFIDAETLDWTTLSQQLITLESHFVIGPLLKGNVDKYLSYTEITLPSLLLNTPETAQRTDKHVILSMRPEDEAIQAATTLSRKNYQMPVVLSHRDNASKRIAQTFTQQWQLITGYSPEIVYFETGNKMQGQLKSSLDIDSSQARIKDLKVRLKQSLRTEARNRRDIDMFYLVGSPNQTKLLKPYIDVNTSPFAKIIPVYASSRSHSSKQGRSKNTDLRNLVFTEMPWLLPSKQQNSQLTALAKTLWPSRSDSLQRIFAMGYDSLFLVDNITKMKQRPYVRYYGQTGTLKLNSNNTLSRSLLWGVYQKDKVAEITMD